MEYYYNFILSCYCFRATMELRKKCSYPYPASWQTMESPTLSIKTSRQKRQKNCENLQRPLVRYRKDCCETLHGHGFYLILSNGVLWILRNFISGGRHPLFRGLYNFYCPIHDLAGQFCHLLKVELIFACYFHGTT